MMSGDFIHQDLVYALSNRADGNLSCNWGSEKEVVTNRRKFLARYGLRTKECVAMFLNHGDGVAVVDESHRGIAMGACGEEGVKADALVTGAKGIYLFLLTADCLPVALYDPVGKALALLHVSRENSNLGLIQRTVEAMRDRFGAVPSNLLAHIGPGIGRRSYKLDFFKEKNRGWREFVEKTEDGKFYVDLPGRGRRQLLDMEIKEHNIYVSSIDTCTSPDYFSHYRSVHEGEDEGRFATVVGMK